MGIDNTGRTYPDDGRKRASLQWLPEIVQDGGPGSRENLECAPLETETRSIQNVSNFWTTCGIVKLLSIERLLLLELRGVLEVFLSYM